MLPTFCLAINHVTNMAPSCMLKPRLKVSLIPTQSRSNAARSSPLPAKDRRCTEGNSKSASNRCNSSDSNKHNSTKMASSLKTI